VSKLVDINSINGDYDRLIFLDPNLGWLYHVGAIDNPTPEVLRRFTSDPMFRSSFRPKIIGFHCQKWKSYAAKKGPAMTPLSMQRSERTIS
jgi:hypothetical protein